MKKLRAIVEYKAGKIGKLFDNSVFKYYANKLYFAGCNLESLSIIIVDKFQWCK